LFFDDADRLSARACTPEAMADALCDAKDLAYVASSEAGQWVTLTHDMEDA